MFDKNGNLIKSYEGHKKSSSPVGANGDEGEVEIAPENITDIGTYNVVAPTGNGVLSGEAWATFTVSTRQIGDVDGDGSIDINDATTIQRYIAEAVTLSDDALLAAIAL